MVNYERNSWNEFYGVEHAESFAKSMMEELEKKYKCKVVYLFDDILIPKKKLDGHRIFPLEYFKSFENHNADFPKYIMFYKIV